jgi:hypothetical protein
MSLVRAFALILRGLVRGRAALALENFVLRQQLPHNHCSDQPFVQNLIGWRLS